MIVIADSNIFISCIYTPDGVTAKILTAKSNIQFFAPDFIYEEIKNHLSIISEKTGKSKKEITTILERITAQVVFYTVEDVPEKYIDEAIKIVHDIDIFDAAFVALHLFKKHKIWTGDKVLVKGLKDKGYDICITTNELKSKLYKK